MYHLRVGLAYCIQTLLLYLAKMGLPINDFQQLMLILGFCTPEDSNNGLCLIELLFNPIAIEIPQLLAIFEFVDKLDFTYLHNISLRQLQIVAPPLDFINLKTQVTGGRRRLAPVPPAPPPPPSHHATGQLSSPEHAGDCIDSDIDLFGGFDKMINK